MRGGNVTQSGLELRSADFKLSLLTDLQGRSLEESALQVFYLVFGGNYQTDQFLLCGLHSFFSFFFIDTVPNSDVRKFMLAILK